MTLFFSFFGILIALMIFFRWYDRTEEGRLFSFIADGRRAGLSIKECIDEMHLRTAYVRLRRQNSEECVRRGGILPTHYLHEKALDVAKEVRDYHGAEMGKRFAAWVATMDERELLLPDAWDMMAAESRRRFRATYIGDRLPSSALDDWRNALTTIRGR